MTASAVRFLDCFACARNDGYEPFVPVRPGVLEPGCTVLRVVALAARTRWRSSSYRVGRNFARVVAIVAPRHAESITSADRSLRRS